MADITRKKIDLHAHVLLEKWYPAEMSSEGMRFPVDVHDIRKNYDRLGIEKGVALPLACAEGVSDQNSNYAAMRVCREHPETIGWWFCCIDPRWLRNSEESDFTDAIRFYKSKGAKGIGEVTANIPFTDPRMQNLFHYAEKENMPVLFHLGEPVADYGIVDGVGLYGLEESLRNFPDLPFIGHSQKWWAEISGDCSEENRNGYPDGKVVPGGRAVELLRKYPNMYADLSAGSGENAMRRDPEFAYRFLEEFQDKLYFGVDYCVAEEESADLALFLDDALREGKISETVWKKICRENALKLLEG